MAAGKRKRTQGNSNNTEGNVEKGTGEYEQLRDQRIRENKERMQSLGILDLSVKLKSQLVQTKRITRNIFPEKKTKIPFPVSEPPRRSSRLKSVDPICYSEFHAKKNKKSSKNVEICIREGSQPELYTEEHEKLLGDSKSSWTLFVDGYGKDGKRIYDPLKGETCHQCRQKTLGNHTSCSKCNLVQGQFCGDCLYMRYGENVIESNQTPKWICPVCRGICNCSLCRKARGWAPTGSLYRKVAKLGFKSVAHYLIQTRRSQVNSEHLDAGRLVSAARSEDTEPSHFLQNASLDADKDTDESELGDYEDEMELEDSKHADFNGTCNRADEDEDEDAINDDNDELKDKKEETGEQDMI